MRTADAWGRWLAVCTPRRRDLRAAAVFAAHQRHAPLAHAVLDRVAADETPGDVAELVAFVLDDGDDELLGAWLAAAAGDEPSAARAWAAACRRPSARLHAASWTRRPATQQRLARDPDPRVRRALLASSHLRPSAAPLLAGGLADLVDGADASVLHDAVTDDVDTLAALVDAADDPRVWPRLAVAALHRVRYAPEVCEAVVAGAAAGRLTGPGGDVAARRRAATAVLAAAPAAHPRTVAGLAASASWIDVPASDGGAADGPTEVAEVCRRTRIVADAHARIAASGEAGAVVDAAVVAAATGDAGADDVVMPFPAPVVDAAAAAPGLTADGAAMLLARAGPSASSTNAALVGLAADLVARFGAAPLADADDAAAAVLWRVRDANPGPPRWWPAGGDAALGAWAAQTLRTGRRHPLLRGGRSGGRGGDARLRVAAARAASVADARVLAADPAVDPVVAAALSRALARAVERGGTDAAVLLADGADATAADVAATARALAAQSGPAPA